MAWWTPLDSELPVVLSRADYDRSRRAFYHLTGMARDDVRLPKLAPPGALLMGTADLDPAFDVAANPADWIAGAAMTFQEALAWVTSRAPGGTLDINTANRQARALLASGRGTASWSGPAHFRDFGEQAALNAQGLASAGGAWAVHESSLAVGVRPKDPANVYLDDAWWYDTPWGRETVTFVAPLVLGQYGWEPAVANALPAGALVLVRWPHPYMVGLPAPIAVGSFITSSGVGDGPARPRRYGAFPSSVILTGVGDRQEPRPYDFTDDAGQVHQVWAGFYEDEGSVSDFGQVMQYVAREAALQAVVIGVASILTFGAGGFAVAGGLAGAGAAAASSSTVALAGAVLSAATPEEVNRALATVAEQSTYLDLVPYLGELADLSFTELTIRAQTTRQKQDDLRIELARDRQAIEGQAWFGPAKQTISAIASAILAFAAPELAPLEVAVMSLTKVAVSATTMEVKLLQAKELATAAGRAVDERGAAQLVPLTQEEAALLAEADDLVRQIKDLEHQIGAAGPGAPAGTTFPAGGPAPAPPSGFLDRLRASWGSLSTGQKAVGAFALAALGAVAASRRGRVEETPKKSQN